MQQSRFEAARPEGKRVMLPGADPLVGEFYEVKSHQKVVNQKPGGRIYIIYRSLKKEVMEQVFNKVSNMKAPANEQEVREQGYLILDPDRDDRVLLRDADGTGHEADDIVKTWSTCKADYTHDEVEELEEIRGRLLGDIKDIGPGKPRKIDGKLVGGIAFERSERAIPVKPDARAYTLASSYQVQCSLLAPAASCKKKLGVVDQELKDRADLIKICTRSTASGMRKGGDIAEALELQAELTNMPRLGCNSNVFHPAIQVNIASAAPFGSRGNTLQSDLGQFGSAHIDGSDSSAAPTAMTVLSKPSDKVTREYFCVIDLLCAWIIREFATIFFSGLHFHGGMITEYLAAAFENEKVTRITVIKYPPSSVLDSASALAFAALPKCTPDKKRKCFNVAIEMRSPYHDPKMASFLNDAVIEERPTEQATITYDAGYLMSRDAYLDNVGRNLVQIIAYFGNQIPDEFGFKFDRDAILRAFSMVNEKNERFSARAWPLGPGWNSEDVSLGPVPPSPPTANDPLSASAAPYNNMARVTALQKYEKHLDEASKSIPICVLSDKTKINTKNVIGGRPGKRKAMVRQSRLQKVPKAANSKSLVQVTNGSRLDISEVTNGDTTGDVPFVSEDVDMGILDGPSLGGDGDTDNDPDTDPDYVGTSARGLGKRKSKSINDGSSQKKRRIIRKSKPDPPDQGSAKKRRRTAKHKDNADIEPIKDKRLGTKRAKASPTVSTSTLRRNMVQEYLNAVEDENIERDSVGEGDALFTMSGTFSLSALIHCESLLFDATPLESDDVAIIQSLREVTTLSLETDTTLGEVLCLSLLFDRLDDQRNNGTVELRFRDVVWHLLNMVLWEWLDNVVDSNPLWLHKLRKQVILALNHRTVDHTFKAVELLETLAEVVKSDYVFKAQVRQTYELETKEYVDEHVTAVLATWLRFPERQTFQPRAWFLRQIINYLGVEGACLPSVSWASEHISSYILKKRSNGKISRGEVESWAHTYLIKLPIVRSCTLESVILKSIFNRLVVLFPTILDVTSRIQVHRTVSIDIQNRTVRQLVNFFSLLFPLLSDSNRPISVPAKDHKLHSWKSLLALVQKFPDKRLPFRDLAPSRQRILSGSGPYSADFIATTEGFFSALIYRGVTHGTQFLQDHPMIFHTLEDWNSLYTLLSGDHDDLYFCDPNAYGCNNTRSVANVPAYWDASQDPTLVSWLSLPSLANFLDVFKLLQKKMPSFGNLTIYLLLVDYAIAGKLSVPTFAEMGYIIHAVNAGGRKGLTSMGFPCRSKEEIADALAFIMESLVRIIPQERRQAMNLDIFLLEHALCKMGRLKSVSSVAYNGAIHELLSGAVFEW
ncbi:hypothetical protein BDN72DRAFT_940373 [Pluteus cervinus]|uniref:Uncharacterized protein n=1 Tax=Pluteus cervinus TaxID=181527 RepID=A0ACD3A3L3_9AGAR|nr:hypothetical protein BDN72DRAFT_940373 [Pluteus cervinus]